MNRLLALTTVTILGLAGHVAGTTTQARSAIETEFSLAGLSCADCANQATKALSGIPGVLEVEVDFDSKKAVVRTAREITRDEIRESLETLGFEARFPGNQVVVPLSEAEKADLDIGTTPKGEALKIEDHLAVGKITIFDYYADWCGPCHLLSPKLERLLLKYQNLALRKVDIIDWETEAAKQATKEFKLPGLPYVRIYSPTGKLSGTVHGNRIEQVEEIIRRSSK